MMALSTPIVARIAVPEQSNDAAIDRSIRISSLANSATCVSTMRRFSRRTMGLQTSPCDPWPSSNRFRTCPFREPAYVGALDAVRALIAAGTDVNASLGSGITALMEASEGCHLGIV
jgi:hypothetical protein